MYTSDDVLLLDIARLDKRPSSASRSRSVSGSSPRSPAGTTTPPLAMPAPAAGVVDRDLDYAATVQHLDSKDWAMWNRLQAHGLHPAEPEDPAVETLGSAMPRVLSDIDMFALEL